MSSCYTRSAQILRALFTAMLRLLIRSASIAMH